jgi:hypothetical protein
MKVANFGEGGIGIVGYGHGKRACFFGALGYHKRVGGHTALGDGKKHIVAQVYLGAVYRRNGGAELGNHYAAYNLYEIFEIGGRVIACASGNRCDIRNTTAFEFFGDSRYNLLIIDHYLSDDIGSRQKLVEHYRHIISPAIIMSPCLIIVYNFCFVKRIAAKENYHYAKKEPCPPAIFDKNIQNPAKHTFDLLRPPQFFGGYCQSAIYMLKLKN